MSTRTERLRDYEARATKDVQAVLREHGVIRTVLNEQEEALVEELVSVVMHPVEHLLLEATR